MRNILVTGVTGNIGRMTLQHLLKRLPAADLVGLARNPEKASKFEEQGIEIRSGDYFDRDGLVRAFEGIDKLMLISATAFTDRNMQHENVIEAANQSRVKHIVYMPIIRKDGSNLSLPQVTEEDIFVEERLKASGLDYTLVRHPPFLENIETYAGGDPIQSGVIVPSGFGRAAYVLREDLAEAHAVVLSESGHENKSYSLYGSSPVSFADVAHILSEASGKPVPHNQVSDARYVAQLVKVGLPEPAAVFIMNWVKGVNAGEWDGHSDDLEMLLGRKPTSPREFLRAKYSAGGANGAGRQELEQSVGKT